MHRAPTDRWTAQRRRFGSRRAEDLATLGAIEADPTLVGEIDAALRLPLPDLDWEL